MKTNACEPEPIAPGASSVEWVELLSRTAAGGGPVDTLVSLRTLLDVFGSSALSTYSTAHPRHLANEERLRGASFEVCALGDAATRWTLRSPNGIRTASVDLTPAASQRVADRDLLARAAVAVGAGQRAVVLARQRAGARFIGGRPLIEMQSTGHRIARMATLVAVARASLLAASRDEDAGRGAYHHAPAVAAGAAEAAFACSQALVQVYGAAGTSEAEPVAAFEACQAAAAASGPPSELWLQAGRRRRLGRSREDLKQMTGNHEHP